LRTPLRGTGTCFILNREMWHNSVPGLDLFESVFLIKAQLKAKVNPWDMVLVNVRNFYEVYLSVLLISKIEVLN